VIGKAEGTICQMSKRLTKTRIVESALINALQYLHIAEQDYSKLDIKEQLRGVKGYKIMIYDRLGRIEERDRTVNSHRSLRLQETNVYDLDIKAVSRLIEEVGSTLASGSRAS
jgi:hypothetical protein